MTLKGIKGFEIYKGEYKAYSMRFKNKKLYDHITKVRFVCSSLEIDKTMTYNTGNELYFCEFLSSETKHFEKGEHIFSIVVEFEGQKPVKEDGFIIDVLENINPIKE